MREGNEIVSFLPFAWVGEQLVSVAIALHVGATVNFPEEPETARDDLREIGPHVMIAPPDPLNPRAARPALARGERPATSERDHSRPRALARGQRALARGLAFRT